MIEREVLEIFEAPSESDGGDLLHEFINQFRSGRDVNELMPLLDSSDPRLVWTGAMTLGEVRFDRYNSDSFIERLRKLLDHEDATVRFCSLGAIYPALSRDLDGTRVLLEKLRNDPNEGVREGAEAATARLGL